MGGSQFSESPLQPTANRLARSGLTPFSGKVAGKVKVIFTYFVYKSESVI
jgi:hypothetical protein